MNFCSLQFYIEVIHRVFKFIVVKNKTKNLGSLISVVDQFFLLSSIFIVMLSRWISYQLSHQGLIQQSHHLILTIRLSKSKLM